MDMTRLMFYNMIKFILIVLWIVVPDTIGGVNAAHELIDSLPTKNDGDSFIWSSSSSSSSPSSLSIPSLSLSSLSSRPSSSVISKSDQSFSTESSSSSTSSSTTTTSTQPPPSSNDVEEDETISNGVNNHSPKFNQSTYSTSMSESSQQGTEVIQVYATDSDEKGTKASMIQYLLLTSDPHFSISSETGIIYLTEPLDYEVTTKHHLIVAASDQGSPLLTSTCQVWVNVIDVNDNGPKFTKESYGATISEASSKDMFITKVTAIDVDVSDSIEEILKYSIVSGDPSGIFKIDPSTGIVRLAKDQSFIYDAFTLNISVTDGRHKDYTILTIKILYANKQSPIFTRPLYSASIDEKSPIGTRVATVEAYDNDDGIYAEVTYSILSSYLTRWFTIDSKSGEIYTISSIDRDKHSSFSLTVLAKDGGHRIALTVVKITIAGDDDAPPQFLVDKYEVAICSNVATLTNILPVIAYDKRSISSSSRGSKNRIFYSISHIGLPESLSISSSSSPSSSSTSSSPSVTSSTTPFRIRKKTGLIYVHGNLSNSIGSVYTFQVKALDENGLESVVPVTIKINGPCKVEGDLVASYESTISEMAKVNSIITSLNFTNPDNLELTLAGINSDANKFKLGEQGQIYLIEPLDRETLSRYILVVKIFDKSTYTVRYLNTFIDVLDTNDNVPTFDSDTYYIEVSEDQEVGSSIGRVHAWDGDGEDSQNAIFYKIKRSKKSAKLDEDYFDIEPETGLIKLRSPLDRELDEWHNLTVTITDGKFNNKTTLSIRVMDVNDNPPQFSSSFFNASIREGSPVGMVVTTIDASDADDSTLTSLNYFITSGDTLNQFTISNTGDLIVNKPLNRKIRDSFMLTILVSDTKYNATTTVSIDVLEAMGPICRKSEYVEIISEDIELGTDILKVEAESKDGPVTADTNVQLFYSLFLNNDKVPMGSMGSDENGLISPEDNSELPFALNSRTGVLTVISPLDREKKSTYFLLAKVHDDKERENMCSSAIEIIVSDINDNEPNFNSDHYHVSIPEDVQLGIVVGKVQAGDADQGRNSEIQYSLTDSSNETFTIDSDTGLIRLNKPLDREKIPTYNLTVKAIDLGLPPLSSTVNFIVTLEDVNDNYPTFTTDMYNVTVLENVTIGSEISIIEATDTDIGLNGNITYNIVDGDEDNRFIIHPKTGIIAVTKLLDREAIPNYLITVKAVDSGSPPLSNKTKVNITIVDVNDNGPVCGQSKYVEMVPENMLPDTFLVKIIANDPDDGPNGKLYFNVSLDSADPDSGKELANSSYLPFAVDEVTGNLRVSGPLDREDKAHYLLTVVAHDNLERERTCSSTVELVISDVNDNPPIFTSIETVFIIQENTPIGTFVGKISAIDKDIGSNGQIKFSISTLGGDDDNGIKSTFSIDEKSGTIFTAKPIDRELINRYSVIITATDSGVPPLSTSKEFTIDILDINDNAPKFTENHYTTSVYENVSVGITLIRVTATSVDTGINEDITYSIVAGNEENCFTVHPKSGSISVVKSLDRETTSEYILTIKADEDGGGSLMMGIPSPISEAKVTITILDVNDNEPRFSQTSYSAVIREDTHVGEKIIQKVAMDGDIKENGQINYYFKASSLNSGTGEMSYHQTKYKEFEIEPKTGIITVASPLDREMISSYIMEVVAIDKGSPPLSSSILITIELSDVNDNPPKFDQTNYTLYIQETKKVGEVVQRFTLTDSDSHINSGPFSLDIVEGNQDGTFGIKVIGEMALILTSPLNRTRQSLYQLMICATDAGSPPLSSNSWVTISVEEEPRPTQPPPSPPIVPTQIIQSYIPISNPSPDSHANPAPGPNANPPNILGNYRYRAFLWDDLILPGIFLIVMLFSCLVIGICCCCFNHHSAASKSRRRSNNRIPPSSYRPGLEGDEFLLESCNTFPSDNSGNLKRFSKMTSVESSALLGHRPFSTEPLPNHHFHQALQQAAANGGGGIGGVGIMGTPNGQIISSGCGGGNNNNSPSGLINNRPNSFHETMNNLDDMIRTPMSERASSGPDPRPKKRSIPKNSPTVIPTSHYAENESSHLLPPSNEGKIQNNINGTMWTNCSNGGSSAGMEGFSGDSSIVSDGVDSYCSNTSINHHHDGGPPDGVAIGNHAYTASHLEPNQPVINSVPILSTTTNGIYANTGYHQYHYAPIQHTHPQNLTYRKGTSYTRTMTDNLSSQGSKSDTINQSNPSDLNTDDETLNNDHDDKRSDGLNIPVVDNGIITMPIDPYLTSER